MFQFKLPDIGEGVAEAEVISWLVSHDQQGYRPDSLTSGRPRA